MDIRISPDLGLLHVTDFRLHNAKLNPTTSFLNLSVE